MHAASSDSLLTQRYRRSIRRQRTYYLRMLGTLSLTLLLLSFFVRLPLPEPPSRVGWLPSAAHEPLQLKDVRLEEASSVASGAPITTFSAAEEPVEANRQRDQKTGDQTSATSSGADNNQSPQPSKLTLRSAQTLPEIQGGMQSYYLSINYPKEAIQKGIQGRLTLDFIVEKNGQPTDIRVTKSLHPLCDSAAVRALRQTLFVPGRQGGDKVRMRMRLPVRFKLVNSTVASRKGQAPSP